MMEFEGKDKVLERAREGETLLNLLQQMSQQMEQMGAVIQAMTGEGVAAEDGAPGGQAQRKREKNQEAEAGASPGPAGEILKAHTPMTSYGQRLAERSRPAVE